jgi:predicted transcriptional regulator
MEEAMMTDAELLNRLDQMAIEIERLRQYILESVATKRQPKKLKSVREYAAVGMWADRGEWQGLSTEEVVERIREKAWGKSDRRYEGQG